MHTASRARRLPGAGHGARRPSRAAPAAPAFSVLELLIAISLLALLAGLVIPLSIGAIARAAAEEAQPRLEAAVAEARLEAARLAAPVRLRASADGRYIRIEGLRLPGTDAGADQPRDPAAVPDPGGDPWAPADAPGEWALLNEIALPDGIILARAAQENLGEAGAALSLLTMSEAEPGVAGETGPPEPWTIATALPDGQVEAGDRLLVRSGSRGGEPSRQWLVRFATWTGAVTLSPIIEDPEQTPEAQSQAQEDGLPPPGRSAPRAARDAGGASPSPADGGTVP